jgi:purine-binding chemotaxis protein CheW
MSALVQLCVFRVGASICAIDLNRVEEIVKVPTLTPLPRAPAHLVGAVRYRDALVPVVDVRARLKLPPSPIPTLTPSGKPKQTERLMVCRIGVYRLGLLVDAVKSVLRVERESLRPAVMANIPGETPHIVGMTSTGSELALLLDIRSLLTAPVHA